MTTLTFKGLEFIVQDLGWENPEMNYNAYLWSGSLTSVYAPYLQEPAYGWLTCRIDNPTKEQLQIIQSLGSHIPAEGEMIYEDQPYVLKDLHLNEYSTFVDFQNVIRLECGFRFKQVDMLPKQILGFFRQ